MMKEQPAGQKLLVHEMSVCVYMPLPVESSSLCLCVCSSCELLYKHIGQVLVHICRLRGLAGQLTSVI